MPGTYPWAGFEDTLGTQFKFRSDEQPIEGTDTFWRKQPKRDQSSNLGSSRDSIRTLAVGSATRTFELWMEQSRLDQFEGMLGRNGYFTDWLRPTPDSRAAYISEVTPQREAFGFQQSCDDDNPHKRKIRTRVTVLSQ